MIKITDPHPLNENHTLYVELTKDNKINIFSVPFNYNYNRPYFYKRIILCGKMASGKDYMRSKLVEGGFTKDVSYTTRPMRKGEQDGVDYIYIDNKTFEDMIANNEFYEYTNFCGWYYGTTLESWSNSHIFIFDAHGLKKVPESDLKESFVIYFDVPLDIRLERLKTRDMGYDTAERRLASDFLDFQNIYHNLSLTIPVVTIINENNP
jgi:guanylate kinase